MGGAFIAIADDATAASWNPAGLIQLERPELSIAGEYFFRKESFTSPTHPEISNTGEVDQFNLNYLSAVYPFRAFERNMVVSLNVQRLLDFERDFSHTSSLFLSPTTNLSSDINFRQNGYVGAVGLAFAVQVVPELSIGATVNLWTDQLFLKNGWTENFTEQDTGIQGGVPVTIDSVIRDDYSKFRGVNANLGLLWNVNEHVSLGAVFKTPFKASLEHAFQFNQTSVFGPPVNSTLTTQVNLIEDVDLDMPMSYGAGISYRVSDALSIALDVYRTDWSAYFLTDSQGNELSPIGGGLKSDTNVRDTTQLRLGGEYLFISSTIVVPVRGGLFYDPEPSDGSPKDFYGVALGSGVSTSRFSIDAAYQFRWASDADTGALIATSKADVYQHSVLLSAILYF